MPYFDPQLEKATGPRCPHRLCGCNDSEILCEPRDESASVWNGAGRAACRRCGTVFYFHRVAPPQQWHPQVVAFQDPVVEAQDPVIAAQEPVVEAPPPPAAPREPAGRPLCPGCDGKVLVTSTTKTLRRYICKDCGVRFKRART